MRSFQAKMLAEFERLAQLHGLEIWQTSEYSNVGALYAGVASRFSVKAYVHYQFQPGHNIIRFNGADLGPGDDSALFKETDEDKIDFVLDRWRDMLYEGYECSDCGAHHRPGALCQWGADQ